MGVTWLSRIAGCTACTACTSSFTTLSRADSAGGLPLAGCKGLRLFPSAGGDHVGARCVQYEVFTLDVKSYTKRCIPTVDLSSLCAVVNFFAGALAFFIVFVSMRYSGWHM